MDEFKKLDCFPEMLVSQLTLAFVFCLGNKLLILKCIYKGDWRQFRIWSRNFGRTAEGIRLVQKVKEKARLFCNREFWRSSEVGAFPLVWYPECCKPALQKVHVHLTLLDIFPITGLTAPFLFLNTTNFSSSSRMGFNQNLAGVLLVYLFRLGLGLWFVEHSYPTKPSPRCCRVVDDYMNILDSI